MLLDLLVFYCYFLNIEFTSITEKHLENAINFSKTHTGISDKDIIMIKHSCKSLLTYDNNTWIKKSQETRFNVPMGSYFGAELCDLIQLYILNHLQILYDVKQIGLYRDDGLVKAQTISS